MSLRHLSPGMDAVPAQWVLRGPEKQGGWSQEGCQLVHSDSSTSTMRCSVLSNYAVLQVDEALMIYRFFSITTTACDFYLVRVIPLHPGSARFPQLWLNPCESAPPCGVRLHSSAPALPLHHHHHSHTTSQVVKCMLCVTHCSCCRLFAASFHHSLSLQQFDSHIKKMLAHVVEYLFPHRHDNSNLRRRHKLDQLPSGLPGSKFLF